MELDTKEKELVLVVPDKYRLELKLPYEVLHTRGSARFDKHKNILTVTLPVTVLEVSLVQVVVEEEV